ALALADPRRAPEDLRHHRPELDALRDRVAVPAVRARDPVVLAEVEADARRDGLLARIEMEEAGHAARLRELVQRLLERADRAHGPVRGEEPVARELAHRPSLAGR